jgi:hypothetical protein
MNLPLLPTDNLYKFVAVAGLVLASYCAFFAYQQVLDIKLQRARAETEEEILKFEINQIEKDTDRIQLKKERSSDELKEIKDRIRSTHIQRLRVIGKKNEIDILNTQVWAHYFLLWAGIIGGLLMSRWAFKQWYFLIQKPNDELMRKSASAPRFRLPKRSSRSDNKQLRQNRTDDPR